MKYEKWTISKEKIDQKTTKRKPDIYDIWWCSVGLNIGTEIFGKGSSFSRPVLVINNEGENSFVGIPLSSKIKNSKYSVSFVFQDKLSTAHVFQIRSFDNKRLLNRIGKINDKELKKVIETLKKLIKI